MVLEQAPGALGEDEKRLARERLAKIKFHPREDEANRQVIARAEALYMTRNGKERDHIGELLARFEAVLAGQDPREIERARRSFKEAIEMFESQPVL